jgi:hypothetical protein
MEPETYVCLPAPELPEIQRAIVEVVTAEQGIASNELSRRVVVQLGRTDDLTLSLVEGVVERLIMDDNVLVVLHPDRLVYPLRLFAGARLAHRVTEFEQELGRLYLGNADLVALEIGPDEEATFDTAVFNVGDLVEVGLGSNDRLEVLTLPSADIDTAIVAEIGELYHEGYDYDGLPVELVDLFAGLCLRRPGVLLHPMAPMSELCVAAGLEVRNNHVGDGPDAWRNMRRGDRAHRAYDIFDGDHETAHRVLETIETLEDLSSSATDLRAAYGSMDDPEIGPVVLELSAGADALEDDAEFEADARAMVAHLVAVARRDDDKSWAHLLAALVEERTYSVLAAEAHLHAAYSANPEFGPIIDRMAWYASDRGDAPAAVRWWRQVDGDPGELAIVEDFAKPARSAMGRNEPCWCGSGRKFKACHLNAVAQPPLPDRVGWLCRKATSYLARRGGEAATDIEELCRCRATDPDDQGSVEAAMDDPIVIDGALTEMGWFETFLEARGPLLPEDEQLLAQSWLLVERTVFEIVEVHTGTGLVVRDLRTGDVLDVRERTMSRHTQVGDLWCARAVPDGESHQFIGGLFIVAPGTEIGLLELLDVGDPFALCEWVRNLNSPPRLATREGEPLVACLPD